MGSGGTGSNRLEKPIKNPSISPLDVTSDTISLAHGITFARPLPEDVHTCPGTPSYDLINNFTRDLGELNTDGTLRYPLDDLPSGGNCSSGSIRIAPSEMVNSILDINQGGTYSVNFKWYNVDTATLLFDFTTTATGSDSAYAWTMIGHYSWEIDRAGNYRCVISVSGYGSATIDFTVTDTRPAPTKNVNPRLRAATAFISGTDNWVMMLYENPSPYGTGMAMFAGGKYDSTVVPPIYWVDLALARKMCIDRTGSLYKKATVLTTNYGSGAFEIAAADSWACLRDDNCTNGTCSDYGGFENINDVIQGIPVVAQNTTLPSAVTDIKATPGNGYLDITWTPASDPVGYGGSLKVFAYYIQVTKRGDIDPFLTGYWPGDSSGVAIGGLDNGITYDITVLSISHNNMGSTSTANVSGIPGVTTVTATTGKYHDLKSYGTFAPWTIVETATFSYGYPMGDLIDPQWCATAPNESIENSKSAIAACLVNLTNIFSSGIVTIKWYKGTTLLNTYTYNIPSPLDYGKSVLDFYSVASWICKVPGYIDAPGNYSVEVTADPYNFSKTIPITVECGSPVANFTTANSATPGILNLISILPTSAYLTIGSTQQYTATCKDTLGNTMTCPTLTWTSSNTAVGTISSSGLFTAIALGTTNITASASGKTSNVAILTVEEEVALESQLVDGDLFSVYYNQPSVGQKKTLNNISVSGLAFLVSKTSSSTPLGIVRYTIRRTVDDQILATVDAFNASVLTTAQEWKKASFAPVVINEEVRICVEYTGSSDILIGYYTGDLKLLEQMSWYIYDAYSGTWKWINSGNYDMAYKIYGQVASPTEEQTSQNSVLSLYSGYITAVGQKKTFTNVNISNLGFYIYKVGSPSGNVTYTIRKASDYSVIGSVVAFDASILSTTMEWKEASFSSPVAVNEEVLICVEYGSGDSSNNILVGRSTTSVKPNETIVYYYAGIGWDTSLGGDMCYKVYY